MNIIDRFDTWILIWFVLFFVSAFLLDRCLTVKRLRDELKAIKRQEHRAWMAAEKARREKRQLAIRKDAAVDYTRQRWKDDVDALTREIEKKDRLLNQKWREALENVQDR